MKRTLLVAAALLGISAPGASAEIRSGTVNDPEDLTAMVDIVRATASYDDGGQVTLTVKLSETTQGQPFTIYASTGSYVEPDSCEGTGVSIFGDTTSSTGFFTQSNTKGLGDADFTISGTTFTATASDALLSDKSYECADIDISSIEGDTKYDDVTVFFKGYGPPVCKVSGVTNKTLAEAQTALKAGNCKVGQVTKPKGKLRKGFKFVVSKAVDRADGTNKVDLTLKAKRK